MNSGAIENSGAEVEATWHVNNNLTPTTNLPVLHMVHHVIAAPEYKGYLGATWHSGKWMVTDKRWFPNAARNIHGWREHQFLNVQGNENGETAE